MIEYFWASFQNAVPFSLRWGGERWGALTACKECQVRVTACGNHSSIKPPCATADWQNWKQLDGLNTKFRSPPLKTKIILPKSQAAHLGHYCDASEEQNALYLSITFSTWLSAENSKYKWSLNSMWKRLAKPKELIFNPFKLRFSITIYVLVIMNALCVCMYSALQT